jgi:hypothetical protein
MEMGIVVKIHVPIQEFPFTVALLTIWAMHYLPLYNKHFLHVFSFFKPFPPVFLSEVGKVTLKN